MCVHPSVFQDKVKTLEIELDEERSGAELLNDRIARSRDQVLQTHIIVSCSGALR